MSHLVASRRVDAPYALSNITDGGRTFVVRAVKDWNNLPRSLKTNKSLKSLQAELWKILLNSQKTKGSLDIN